MSFLLILNDPPYGTERSYNGLRLAASLCRSEESQLYMFLIGDAVACALAGQMGPSNRNSPVVHVPLAYLRVAGVAGRSVSGGCLLYTTC